MKYYLQFQNKRVYFYTVESGSFLSRNRVLQTTKVDNFHYEANMEIAKKILFSLENVNSFTTKKYERADFSLRFQNWSNSKCWSV